MTSKSLLGRVIELALCLGEVRYRQFLAQEQLKGLNAQDIEDRVFRKSRAAKIAQSRHGDYILALEEHRKHLVRMKFLVQQDLESDARISLEIEELLGESITGLKTRLA